MNYGWTLHLGVCGIMTSQLFYEYEGVSTQKLSENSTTTDLLHTINAGWCASYVAMVHHCCFRLESAALRLEEQPPMLACDL